VRTKLAVARRYGRQNKCTPTVQEVILSAVRSGNFMTVAAQMAGVDESAIYFWLKRGAQNEQRPQASGDRASHILSPSVVSMPSARPDTS
jgi:transposase-like protein